MQNKKPTTAALKPLLDAGYTLLPLNRPFAKKRDRKGVMRDVGKVPLDAKWTTKTYDSRKVVKTYGGENNIGVQIGADDLIMDIDVRHNGKIGLRKFREAFPDWDYDAQPKVITGGGGIHVYTKIPEGFKPVETIAAFEGIEFKVKGRQVVAPGSIHPQTGKYYHWEELSPPVTEAQPLPKQIRKAIKRPPPPDDAPDAGEVEAEQLGEMLSYLDPEEYGSNDKWLPLMMACHHATGGAGRQEFIDFSTSDPAYADAEIEIGARWDSLSTGKKGGVTSRTLYKALHEAECPRSLIPGESPDDQFDDEFVRSDLDEEEPASEPESDDDDPKDMMQDVRGLQYTRASEVEMKDYEWLWENRFALGHLHALFGLPGQGKGMLMCAMAAILSRGSEWPDHSGKAPKMQCAILSAEDNANESLAPRLLAADADLDSVFIVQATIKEMKKVPGSKAKSTSRVFNISDDLKKLTGLVKKHPELKVLFIDPIGAFIGNGKQTDSYKSAEVRAILTPITEWASRRGICVIYISHANKNGTGRALNRMTDSQAFGAAPRFVWIVGPDPVNPESGNKIFAAAKVNIAKEVSALEFRIEDAAITLAGSPATRGRVHWLGESNATADQVVSPPTQNSRASAIEAAETFLSDLIEKSGPVKQADIKEKADGIHSWRTIRRAKRNLAIISRKEPGVLNGDWLWDFAMPDGEPASDDL